MPFDWTKSETISPPDNITIKWKTDSGEEKEQVLVSTTKSTSQTNYETIEYTDADGNNKRDDVASRKEDIKFATKASINQEFISMRLKYGLGLPQGGDQERSVTTNEYSTSTDGPVLVKETTDVFISWLAFMGQLQGIEYSWVSGNPPAIVYYAPPNAEVLSHRTIVEHEQIKTNGGRDMTRTKTSRWTAVGATSEGKTSFAMWMKILKRLGFSQSRIDAAVESWTPLKFEGTEVQISVGRAPVPTKPSDLDLAANEVVNGNPTTSDTSLTDKYGNDLGWPAYVPNGIDPKSLIGDKNGDGKPDWWQYVPDEWQDYNKDSNNDGEPDWAKYIPSNENWQDYNKDSNNDGVPDWADKVPIGWEAFDTKDTDYVNPEPTSNNEHLITGSVVFDGQAYNDGDPTVTASYDMPFAPDDYFTFVNRIRKIVPQGARSSAQKFGQTESALDIGHAYGFNIVTGFAEIPTLELAPVYIRLAGLEVAFLTDSLSYAWGPEGMVVSSDLMLVGVTGYYGGSAPASSWARLPVATSLLRQATTPTVSTAQKANTIAIPSGYSAANPGPTLALLPTNGTDTFAQSQNNAAVVPPVLILEKFYIESGPVVDFVEFEYPLNTGTDVLLIESGPAIDFEWVTAVTPPSVAVTATAGMPIISTGARIVIPAAAITMAGAAPTIGTMVVVSVPAATVSTTAVAPAGVGQLATFVNVPAAAVTAAVLLPVVSKSAAVAVPAAGITVAPTAPDEAGPPKADYWGAWSQQVYGYDRDWSVDWWAD